MKHLLVSLVRLYQRFISPLFPPTCRFQPSCSHYAIASLTRFGFLRGSGLALWRILRCHPWNKGGYDPVPDVFWTTDKTSLADVVHRQSSPQKPQDY
ncbi:membrane protein insertion efficiency factor YidD [Acaryochloris thomasi]|uniref:membrane protein insertion efficiency factor YidD n=1 Tax=Acaryochloris thomasi TaxID=2929456 RepID=UPI000DA692A3|nr:membrane protein insertion efficiency factor YidD [Acaryochloris thomasi]